MARRRADGALADCFELAAKLPWWVGATIAVATWALLHRIATTDMLVDMASDRLVANAVRHFVRPLAGLLQYLVPALFLAGAIASFVGRRRRAGLVRSVASQASIAALRTMSWQDFELLVGEVFRTRGYTVVERGGGGADGGVDLELSKEGERHLVQCKQWRAFKVPVGVVRELFGVMAAEGAAGGFVVTSGVFTAEAKAFADGRNIELIDGPALVALTGRAPRAGRTAPDDAPVPSPAAADTSAPCCPRCGGDMVRRVAKRGANAGGEFWGCVRYPACKGIRSID